MRINFVAKTKRKLSESYLTSLLFILLALLAVAIWCLDTVNQDLRVDITEAEQSWQELNRDLVDEEHQWRERQKFLERDTFLRKLEREALQNRVLLDALLDSLDDDPNNGISIRSIVHLEAFSFELRGSCPSLSDLTDYQNSLREQGFKDIALLVPVVRSSSQQNYSFSMSLTYTDESGARGNVR